MLDLQGNFFVSTKSFQYIYLVNLTGLRQIGKTTLAGLIAMKTPKVYIRGSDLTSAEIGLVLERGGQDRYAIEIKRSLVPSLSKGFYLGCEDIGATKRFLVYPGAERYPISGDVEVMPLEAMVSEILSLGI